MNIVERYNQTIELIEKMAVKGEYSAREIGAKAADENGLQLRDMSTIFLYLQNMTLYSYIMERKLTAAYKFLIDSKKRDISHAVAISGYSDQPSFSKAFKRQFGSTPFEAFKDKDKTKIKRPLTWEVLSGNANSPNTDIEENEKMMENTVFGISENSFNKVSAVLELEAFYGLSRMFSNYAYDLSEKTGYSLEECFSYADSLHKYIGEYEPVLSREQSPEEALREIGDNEIIQTVFFARGISVDIIEELREDYNASLDDLMKCDMEMLDMFPGFELLMSMSFSYYIKAYERFAEYADITEYPEVFYDYISELMIDKPIEVALENALVEIDFNRAVDDGSIMDGFDMKREIEEIETYRSAEGLMAEYEEEYGYYGKGRDKYDELYYDPDNSGYNDYDEEEEW